MALWKSTHPELDIPTNVTTWEWAFESPEYSSVLKHAEDRSGLIGAYENAVTKERLDFLQVKTKAASLSAALVLKHGLKPEDTVSVFSTNTIWYPVAMWATIRAGGRVNGASPAYNVDEMIYALKTANTKILFTLPTSIETAAAAASAAQLPPSRIFLLEGYAEGYLNIEDLISSTTDLTIPTPYRIPLGKTNASICGYLNFSSGTTGLPKAVMLSHHNVIAQCHQLRQLQVLSPYSHTADIYRTPLPPYRILAVMPLFHITGLVRFLNYPVFMNGLSVMLPTFTMPSMLQNILTYQIEELILVPPILHRIVRDEVVVPYLPDLRRVVKRWSSGSAPISVETIRRLHKMFPASGFRQGYGATESTACISSHPPEYFDFRYAHTGGKLVANTVARVRDLEVMDRFLGVGEVGEICARGPQIAMGYLGDDRATKETFDEERFFCTGDVGYIDEDGMIHVVDRIKEMIKVKGQQVAPVELESLLLGSDGVEDVAVVGMNDEYAGERPKAYVVPKGGLRARPNAKLIELGKTLLETVRAKKVRYKWIVELEFVEAVPKSPTGKLLRRVLKTMERDITRQRGVVIRDDREYSKL